MKTWEMIKELTENPDKKFKTNDNGLENSYSYVFVKNGEVKRETKGVGLQKFSLNYGHNGKCGVIHWDWEEVIEQVDFLTAYKDCLENGTKYIVKGQHDTIASIYNVNGDVQIHTLIHGFTLSDKWIKVTE